MQALQKPVQKRAQKSLDRLLDAAEALLDEVAFDDITIADVVQRAKSSVGVFYSRFDNKEALLAALYERHQQDIAQQNDQAGLNERGSLADVLRARIERAASLYREHPGLYRALLLHGYLHPDWRYRKPSARARLSVSRAGELVEQHADDVTHEQPRAAGAAAYLFALGALREKFLFGDSTAAGVPFDDETFVSEVCRMAFAYLGIREPA